MKAYKIFNNDWSCRGFQFKVGEIYEMKEKPLLCERGFHACKKAIDCFNYYEFNQDNKVAEVELLGDVVGKDGDKQATNKIKIVREIAWHELLEIVNAGEGNTGYRNSGNLNSGNLNSGNCHTGHFNSKEAEKHYVFNRLVTSKEKDKLERSEGFQICQQMQLVRYRVRTASGKYGDYRYLSYKSSWRHYWNNLTFRQRNTVREMPFFDKEVFNEITGVTT